MATLGDRILIRNNVVKHLALMLWRQYERLNSDPNVSWQPTERVREVLVENLRNKRLAIWKRRRLPYPTPKECEYAVIIFLDKVEHKGRMVELSRIQNMRDSIQVERDIPSMNL